ncbi:MAG: N-acetyltransferase [Verrucomicrobia bacterium]|nr:N-acetyltransferase [Verrucomicrobiota bacterium]MBI3867645.1 N-acetyltransferase [Verrucomicrobiota bacterium]
MSAPTIRRAAESDLPAISAIYNHAVLHTTATYDYEPENLERRVAWFEEHRALGLPVFVAERDGTLLGWSSLSPYHRRPGFRFTVENSIYVAEAHRGKGLGGLLLAPLIQSATEQGLRSIIAAIDASNAVSVRLHEKFGFREVGRFPAVGYKFDRWLDVAYLQRVLTPSNH